MIVAGRYDWANTNITAKRFPLKGTGVQQFEGSSSSTAASPRKRR
jgi:hypothetical protein